jgi:hypothetical protein
MLAVQWRSDRTLTAKMWVGAAEFKAPLEDLITSNGGSLVPLGDTCHFLVRCVLLLFSAY